MNSLLKRLTSRKFLAAVVGAVIGILAAADVINPTQSQAIIAQVTPLVYIVVEGALDLFNRILEE